MAQRTNCPQQYSDTVSTLANIRRVTRTASGPRYLDIYTDIYTYLHLGAGRGDINFVNNNKCNNAPHTATAGTDIINDIFI